MTCEWKPGDVAMVELPDGGQRASVLVTSGGDRCWHSAYDDGSLRCLAAEAVAARPLVVIDPEDAPADPRRFLEHLSRNWFQAPDDFKLYGGTNLLDWLASQFEPPAPPRPDEPTGVGAVVEDEDGVVWVRVEPYVAGNSIDVVAWRSRVPNAAPKEFSWPNITAVRILSEGVKP